MGLQYVWPYCTHGPLYMWAPSTCAPTIHVGLQYIWAYCIYMWACCTYFGHSRPTYFVVHVGPHYVGPPYILAYYTCGPTIHVNLLINLDPQYMRSHNTCRPTIHVGPQYMRAYYPYGRTVHVGPLYMSDHNACNLLYCGPPIHLGLLYSRPTCTVGPIV